MNTKRLIKLAQTFESKWRLSGKENLLTDTYEWAEADDDAEEDEQEDNERDKRT